MSISVEVTLNFSNKIQIINGNNDDDEFTSTS